MRVLARSFAFSLLLTLAVAGVARAQGPVYTPHPPTKSVVYEDGQTDRYLLGGGWLYRADPSNVGVAEGWWQNTSSTEDWNPASVPNAYNAGDFSNGSWYGYVGWYRKDFTLPVGAFPSYVPASARHWIVRFEEVNYYATVWLNGREIGAHAGSYLPWEITLTGLRSGVNRLIVRVDNRTNGGDLPPGPGSQWWSWGGILREVYLRAAARADLQQVRITPVLPCPTCAATISEQATIRNVTNVTETVRLHGLYGHIPIAFGEKKIPARGTWNARAVIRIAHPRLWAPGSPALYKATLTLADSHGRSLGGYLDFSGIRSVIVKRGRLELNGRTLSLRGFDMQEENVSTGGALTPAQTMQLIDWVRELGGTVIRTHYPVGPLMEELADRYGILIWDEVPVFGVSNTYLSRPGWVTQADQMLRQNVLDNQNHPSILLWSVGNELPTPASNAEASYIRGAVTLLHELDPTRPVGMAVDNWPGLPCQTAYGPLDVLGLNEYFGLFQQGGGTTDDRDALSPYLDTWRACYPHKALLLTEFGFDGNRSGPVEEYGTYQFQSDMAAFHLGVFATKQWLSGAIYQTLQDFAAYPYYNGGNPFPISPWNQKGLLDRYGNPKPAFTVVSQTYRDTLQIAARPSK